MMEYSIQKNPYNERYYYYYSQALICAQKYYTAIDIMIPFILRCEGEIEEIYMALLTCGNLETQGHICLRYIYNNYIRYKNTKNDNIKLKSTVLSSAIECYHCAFNLIPARKEAPFYIICYHLKKQEVSSAIAMAKCALVITDNNPDMHLFIDKIIAFKFYIITLELMKIVNDTDAIQLAENILKDNPMYNHKHDIINISSIKNS